MWSWLFGWLNWCATAIPVELPFWLTSTESERARVSPSSSRASRRLLAGSLPAWQSSRVDVSEALKVSGAGNTGGGGAGARTREFLMVAQVAVSVVPARGRESRPAQHAQLDEVDPGFDARDVLMMEVNPTYNSEESAQLRVDRFTSLLERIAAAGRGSGGANNSPPFVAAAAVEPHGVRGRRINGGGAEPQSAR